jgi:hypothetical protein
VEVVGTAREADAVREGKGETWVKGYLSSRTRCAEVCGSLHLAATYRLSCETNTEKPMWSYTVTPVMRRIEFDGSASSTVQVVPIPNQPSEYFSNVTRTS